MKIGIVIAQYNKWDLTLNRLRELYSHCPGSMIVLVDDHSPDADCRTGPKWWQDGPMKDRLKYFRNPENIGFGGSMNNGFRIAVANGCDAAILLSNDVTVMSNIVQDVERVLELDKNVLIGGELLFNDTGWNKLPGCCVIPYANGWFLAAHKSVWKRLGGFDPRYGRFDYEDVDLSTTAWMQGIKLVTCGARLRHQGGVSVAAAVGQSGRYAQTIKNKQIWIEKWSPYAAELKEKIYGQSDITG